jgi:hypothetical protein
VTKKGGPELESSAGSREGADGRPAAAAADQFGADFEHGEHCRAADHRDKRGRRTRSKETAN